MILTAMLGFGVSSASAHTVSASGECGSITFGWTSFAGSGSKPTNKVDWRITRDSNPNPIASGQKSFSGTNDSLTVPIPSLNGTYVASSSWTSANTRDGHSGSGQATVKLKNCNEISTTASAAITLGGQIFDTAHLVGGTDDISGTIEFKVYAESDTECENALGSSAVPVSGNGDYRSEPFTPTAAGGYQWTASYSGDQKNGSLGPHGCGVPAEHVVVSNPPPTPPPTTPPPTTPPPTVDKPGQGVKSVCRSKRGRLRLNGPSGNVRGPFKLKIRSRGHSRLTIYVDGRKIRSMRKLSLTRSRITVRINSRRMNPGVHRIKVVGATGPRRCSKTTRGLRFVRARPPATLPTFTG